MKKNFVLLAIETSCDETAAAVIECDPKTMHITALSSVVASQINLHKKFGGVFPEMASRAHSQKILPVVAEALQQASCKLQVASSKNQSKKSAANTCNFSLETFNFVDALAVTTGPGLAGSLIVGVEFARGLAAATGIPVVPVNHLEGHIYANFVSENTNSQLPISNKLSLKHCSIENSLKTENCQSENSINAKFPALALVVSGGHTLLIHMKKHLDYQIIGSTLDDAAGEAFDKVARMLNLPYPGGPALEQLALLGNPKAYDFPRSMLHSKDYNFSFSGLKTAVFYKLRSLGLVNDKAEPIAPPARGGVGGGGSRYPQLSASTSAIIRDTAASFQQAVIDVLVTKTLKAAEELKVKSILVGGGVISNSAIRSAFQNPHKLPLSKPVPSGIEGGETKRGFDVFLSPKHLATDNALSIAVAGAHHFVKGHTIPWQKLDANASLKLV